MRGQRGQASVEWIGAVLVVVVVLAAAAAGALPGADAVPRAVGAAFARAFCLVSGGDCLSGAPRPCVVRSVERSHERRLTIFMGRLADGRSIVREERSDGTVVVSVEDSARAGGGVRLGLNVGGVGGSARAMADVRGGRGRRFVAADGAAADRLIARLGEERSGAGGVVAGPGGGGLPPVDERWWSVGSGGEAEAELGGLGLAGVEAEAFSANVASVRERPRTGERTLVLRSEGELAATLLAPLARSGLTVPSETSLELTLDRRNEPVALTARGVRALDAEARFGSLRAAAGRLVEVEARLDLADPVARGLAAEALDALTSRSPGAAIGPARALGERLADRARLDVRVYATDREAKLRGGKLGFLLRAGYQVEDVTRTARLVDAAGREPGLGWARRLDCVGVA